MALAPPDDLHTDGRAAWRSALVALEAIHEDPANSRTLLGIYCRAVDGAWRFRCNQDLIGTRTSRNGRPSSRGAPVGSPTRRPSTAAATLRRRGLTHGPGAGAAAAKGSNARGPRQTRPSPARQRRSPGGWRGTRCQTELAESEAVSGDRTRPPPAHSPPSPSYLGIFTIEVGANGRRRDAAVVARRQRADQRMPGVGRHHLVRARVPDDLRLAPALALPLHLDLRRAGDVAVDGAPQRAADLARAGDLGRRGRRRRPRRRGIGDEAAVAGGPRRRPTACGRPRSACCPS